MDTLQRLLELAEQRPLVFIHMLAAFGTLALGAVLLARRKGNRSHRTLGWSWTLLMTTVVVTSLFIRESVLPNLAGFTPIHLLSAYVAVQLPRSVMHARRGDVLSHRRAMRRLYIGGCVVAGLFTLMPGRFLGSLLWSNVGALVA
jgi:uncharacterized membrane protein